MALLPMALWGMTVPAGDVAVPARAAIPASYRISMAALDPSAESQGPSDAPLRATLKVFRQSLLDDFEDDEDDDEDDESFDADEMDRILAGEDSESSDDDEDVNGGPSDPAKSKKARKEQARKEIKKLLDAEGMDVDDDDEAPNGINGDASKSEKALGKMPASDEEEDSEIDSDEEGEIEEFVVCTLDTNQHYQQPLDITIGDDERVWFKVTGTHDVYLTGNYVEPADSRPGMFDPDSDDDEDYDMEPDEDELDESMDEDESVDDLDDMEDPRVTEVGSDDEEAPQLAKVEKKKNKIEQRPAANKNKRPAEEDAEGGAETLDDMITKEKAAAEGINGEPKLSKKQLKKLKKNDGQAGAAPVEKAEKVEVEAPSSNGKKVQFAKELEQGPTPTKADTKDDKSKAALGVKTVQGVTIDDKKLGSGQGAKNGDRISMRYIGKLKDGKVFDSNKKGKPFSFKLGAGEVIKGWEIGVQGIQAGGERRITIPAHHAYGSKKLPDIPANSTLVFDVKALEVGKSGGK